MRVPSELRARNVESVVTALRRHGSVSRTALAQLTGLSRTTVLSILDELERGGYVGVGEPARGLGRPAARVALRPAAGVALGVFVAHDWLELVLTDLALRVLALRNARFTAGTPVRPLVELALELAAAMLDEARVDHEALVGAVLALPGPIDAMTGRGDAAVLGEWADPWIPEHLSARLSTGVALENDANAEALAEVAMGVASGFRDVLYVHVADGIGGALVLDGQLRQGRTGGAGEIAHVRVRHGEAPLCKCGRHGCLVSVADGRAIRRALAPLHGGELDLEGVMALARGGDAGAVRVLADAGDEIGAVLAALCTTLDPEAVVVGGTLGADGSPLLAAIRRRIGRDALTPGGEVPVLPAALGRLGGALGAASVVVRSGDLSRHRISVA